MLALWALWRPAPIVEVYCRLNQEPKKKIVCFIYKGLLIFKLIKNFSFKIRLNRCSVHALKNYFLVVIDARNKLHTFSFWAFVKVGMECRLLECK